MPKLSERLDRGKEKALFALVLAATAATAWFAFAPTPPPPAFSAESRMDDPPPAGAVMGAGLLYARPELEAYWNDADRYVFVEPAPVRVFHPVELSVPTIAPPLMPMALPDPGPALQFSGFLPRAGESGALKAPEPAGDAGGVE